MAVMATGAVSRAVEDSDSTRARHCLARQGAEGGSCAGTSLGREAGCQTGREAGCETGRDAPCEAGRDAGSDMGRAAGALLRESSGAAPAGSDAGPADAQCPGAAALRVLRALRSRRARRRARVLGPEALEVEDLFSLLGLEAAVRPGWDGGLASLVRLAPDELGERLQARTPQAWRLAAAFELGRRAAAERSLERPLVRGPADVQRLLAEVVRGEEREQFHVLLLDGKHRLKARHTVSIGSLSTSIVHPREVFRPAVRAAAAAVLCAHNHPSGDPEPSPEDVAVTQRLDQAGKLLGIPLLDHVVLGDGQWVSMRQRLALA